MRSKTPEAVHSSTSTSPSFDVSRTLSARSRRFGWSRNWRFGSPHVRRKDTTVSFVWTASTISAFVSVPLQSTSMRSKHLRAAFKNSLLNSSISLAARAASSSRLAARSASLFLRASSIAASLRGTPTGEPRETRRRSRGRGDGVLLRHQHAIAAAPASKAPQIIELRSAPLDHVDVPVPIGVEHGERRLEARRDQQVLEVFIAAVDEELDNFLCA